MYFWTVCCENKCVEPIWFNWQSARELVIKLKKEKEGRLRELIERCRESGKALEAVLVAYSGGTYYAEDRIAVKKMEIDSGEKEVLVRVCVEL